MSYPTYRRTAAEATVAEAGGPRRIQRRRTRGWRMPDGAVYVGRPTRWGNPFTLDDVRGRIGPATDDEVRERCVSLFRDFLNGGSPAWMPWTPELRARRRYILDHLHLLAGRDLACWCPPGPCHADVLRIRAWGEAWRRNRQG